MDIYEHVIVLNAINENDPKIMMKSIETETILKCECGGLVKPDIIFFGENLPLDFFEKSNLLDLEKIVNDLGIKDAYEKIKHEVLNPKEKEIIEKSKI